MTLDKLVDAQKNWGSKRWVKAHWGYNTASSAAGASQLMRATLHDIPVNSVCAGLNCLMQICKTVSHIIY